MKNKSGTYFLELSCLFLILTLSILFVDDLGLKYQFDKKVLWAGNFLLFLLAAFSLYLHATGTSDKNPNVFFRTVYSSMLLRMTGVIIALIIYIFIAGSNVNQPSVLTCLTFYFIYTFYEIRIVLRILKKQDDGKKGSSDSIS